MGLITSPEGLKKGRFFRKPVGQGLICSGANEMTLSCPEIFLEECRDQGI